MAVQSVDTLERPEDAGKGSAGVVKRWLMALELADKEEEQWRKAAREALERYREERKSSMDRSKARSRFNMLWANTELIRPSLYSATPRPDVRRRYRDPDPTGRQVSELIERAAKYTLDVYDFDHVMSLAVLDYVLPGRGVSRVRYERAMGQGDDPEVVWEKAICEHVQWARFRRGPGNCWEDVEWIAFEHLLERSDIEDLFPGKSVEMDVETSDNKDRKDGDQYDLFKRGRVWEIWDKRAREVIWIAPSNDDEPVRREPDPLRLRGFFPVPRPLYSIDNTDTLVPQPEYEMYRAQCEELDDLTQRIRRLVNAIKVRGIYDSTLSEFNRLLEAGDNELIPSEGAQNILSQTGTLDRHVWMLPIEMMAKVLASLYTQREQIKQTIYEITGLSDILRGSTDPNETLGAQQLKAQTGSLRLQRRQREVQRYARDLIEMKIEIMAEHFAPETLSIMTGVQVDPQALALLRDGGLRDYRIDIETDSTISADQNADQEQITRLLQGIASYFEAVGPVVQAGAFPMEAAKSILVTAVRKFKFGREVEDALDQMGEDGQQGQQQGPDPAQLEQMRQQMMEQAQAQAEQSVAQEREAVKMEAEKVRNTLAAGQKEDGIRKAEIDLQKRDAMTQIKEAMLAMKTTGTEMSIQESRIAQFFDQGGKPALEAGGKVEQMEAEMEKLAEAIAQLMQFMAASAQRSEQSQQAILSALAAPREIERDSKGRIVGARMRLDS